MVAHAQYFLYSELDFMTSNVEANYLASVFERFLSASHVLVNSSTRLPTARSGKHRASLHDPALRNQPLEYLILVRDTLRNWYELLTYFKNGLLMG